MAQVIPFIPLITAGVKTGADIYAQHKASDTAKDIAANTTKAAAEATAARTAQLDKALALQQQMYQQGSASLQPWITQGTSAVNTMGTLMGLPQPAASAATTSPPTTTTPTLGSTFASDPLRYTSRPTTPGNQDMGRADLEAWRDQRAADIRAKRMAQTTEGADPASAPAQRQSSFVKMQAPDGTTQDVPDKFVNYYRSLGATVLG